VHWDFPHAKEAEDVIDAVDTKRERGKRQSQMVPRMMLLLHSIDMRISYRYGAILSIGERGEKTHR
jgi:hypothetical protein